MSNLKELYQSFFERHGHKRIASASLVPENDPSVLFTTAGMHPLVPFLMGESHPSGKRLTNVQKCIRTGDIDEVGDSSHLSFFEMLGNWSLGDYFKEEAIQLSFDFLTKELQLPVEKLSVTCFAGDDYAPCDDQAAKVWLSLGIPKERIAFLGKKDNWWGPAGTTGPCGPDTEMFFWTGSEPAPTHFDTTDSRWVEIWNDVFMQYDKTKEGKFIPLKQTNVDTGLGVERVQMVLNGLTNVYEIPTLKVIMDLVKSQVSITNPSVEELKSLRVITDHLRASVFIMGDFRKISPSNLDQGYVLRRFIRRSIRHYYLLKTKDGITEKLAQVADIIIQTYSHDYPELLDNKDFILKELRAESKRFNTVLEKGLSEIEKKMKRIMIQELKSSGKEFDYKRLDILTAEWMSKQGSVSLDSKWLFDMFQSKGMPREMVVEEVEVAYHKTIENKQQLYEDFDKEYVHHQELSRVGAEKRFKGGLADDNSMTRKLHTATHMLNEVLRVVLSKDIKQKGSNITSERLRFDFNFDRKLTDEEKKSIEDLMNKKIQEGLPVTKVKMPLDDAMKSGAQAEFGARYPDEVWVYSIGDFSKEICTGPHVDNTSELGHFKIKKEESSAAGVRRIKAILTS